MSNNSSEGSNGSNKQEVYHTGTGTLKQGMEARVASEIDLMYDLNGVFLKCM